jgi:hypothetical protein
VWEPGAKEVAGRVFSEEKKRLELGSEIPCE